MNIRYDDVKQLRGISDRIIRKTCALKDISIMMEELKRISENPEIPTRLNLEIGSHAIGLSISEIPSIEALLKEAKDRIESNIMQDNEAILSITKCYQ